MIEPDPTLALIWACIIAFAIAAYVFMDGFDLGIGILFPFFPVGKERDQAMNAIAPVWDGNETWLVMGGGGLLAAFPLAYSIILPALYPPIIAMLLGLVFRGVAFEFRWRDPRHRPVWDVAFFVGSTVAALSQGMILGALLQGIHVEGRAYAGGWWDWLTPFTVLAGLSLVIGYALLGACFLLWKTEGLVHEDARRHARYLAPLLVLAIGAVSLATPFLQGHYYRRWFAWPNVLATAQVPLLVIIVAGLLFWSLAKGRERAPFFLTMALFLLSMAGLAVSIFPDVIPGRVSIYEAAAPGVSQGFMLVGAVILIPVILAYTGWAYWVFRGKVGEAGYH
ncbi:MAG TPA: cytochrome d ubiquinol oxidase subunit II [Sphingomonas sp.]|nr:cytochrome d ubiquinol oxidase subunit II [Sphingomonas sp.]